MINKTEHQKSEVPSMNTSLFLAAVIAITLIISVLVAYFITFNGPVSTSQGDWGVFGDFLGGTLNPVFSALTFLLVLVSFNDQRRQNEKADLAQEKTSSVVLEHATAAKQTAELSTLNGMLEFYSQSKLQVSNEIFSFEDRKEKIIDSIKSLSEKHDGLTQEARVKYPNNTKIYLDIEDLNALIDVFNDELTELNKKLDKLKQNYQFDEERLILLHEKMNTVYEKYVKI